MEATFQKLRGNYNITVALSLLQVHFKLSGTFLLSKQERRETEKCIKKRKEKKDIKEREKNSIRKRNEGGNNIQGNRVNNIMYLARASQKNIRKLTELS